MDKNGVKREFLLEPWPKVAYHFLRYITCDGRLSLVYAYNFIFLHHLRHLFHQNTKQNLSIPFFLLESLREMRRKVNRGKNEVLEHDGLIKIIVCEALENISVKVSWEQFLDMDNCSFLDSQYSIQESNLERDVKGNKKESGAGTSKNKNSPKKIKIEPTEKEVATTLIKLMAPPSIPLKIKEKSTFQR